MPIRQLKEGSEQHIVIKPHLQNSMNPVHKHLKTAQNGKAPPGQETQNGKSVNQSSPTSKSRGRRRGRGGRKSDQGDQFMRPSTRPCTAEYTVAPPVTVRSTAAIEVNNDGCKLGGEIVKSFPSSSKSLSFAQRPGYGQIGTKCVVKANHFLAALPEKDLNHYDVTITPEVASRNVNRAIIAELVKLYKESDLGMRLPAYDGRKSLYTAGELPFAWKEFKIKLTDEDDGVNIPKRVREYNVVIKFVARANMHHLGQFLAGKQTDAPQEALQILDIVLREISNKRYCPVGRSFFSPNIRKPQRLGEGLESWCGFYQSIRPTQMGLSLNLDMASAAFIEAIPVIEFVAQLLGKDVVSRTLSDSDRVKIKKALRGVKVEVTHRGNVRRKYRVSGLTSQPTRELVFPVDGNSNMKSVVEYFQEMYDFTIQHTHLPCLQVGNQRKANYLPLEACKIVEGQRYTKRLNEKQITALLKVTCQRPRDRENDILQTVQQNAYDQDQYAKEFGMSISEKLASVEARVLPAPWLKYHENGKEKDCLPQVGQWNMMNKKMINGMTVSRWACINFSRSVQDNVARGFCSELARMCQVSGMEFNPEPVIPIYVAWPDDVEKALKHVYHASMNKLKGKELELLLVILPDNNGSLYGDLKRICETDLGLISQCCLTKHVFKISKQYLANVSLKINVKMGGRNTVLLDAISCRIPLVSDIPTIIFGADVTHPENGEDSSPSIAAVVASQDWPEVTKYAGLVCAQAHRQELIQDLYKTWQDPVRGTVSGGMIRDLLISFRKATGQKPLRIIGIIQNKLDGKDGIIVQFKICCPDIEKETAVYVIGSSLKLGRWKVQDGLKLNYAGESLWQADCVMQKDDFPIKYKYSKYGKEGNFSLETGPNRELLIDFSTKQAKYIVLSDGMMREMPWRGAGVAVPMFSIRSEADLGAGEFLDLKLLVDWAVDSGFHLVQLLPINDTSVNMMWWDSYPYSSLSVCALHPLYLRVQALSENIPEDIKQEIKVAREQLDGKHVDYEATLAKKLSIAKKLFDLEKDVILSSSSFNKFFTENEDWLRPYAAFCFLRDFFGTSDHSQWGCFSQFSSNKLEKLTSKDSFHYSIVCFHYYIQFHLHIQLLEASEYARKKGVVLKGDLPIGVDRNSVDTWVYPTLFRMNSSTGAPPDYFDKNGQNWGFPTYNWEEMSKDNYAWWRARLTQMGKYFTAYRIDHILGFFRIWELPDHAVTGLVGKFRPSIPLSQEELEKEGIWDFDRLSRPYILQEHIKEVFGPSWTLIAANFMNEYQKNRYEFKEDCNTERKIASMLKSCVEKSLFLETEVELRRKLFDLLQNIVLIRDAEDPWKFYPRFNLEDTSNFKDLDEHSKNVLKRLYCDYYFHRQENLWRENALKTLPALLNSSDMLACGEDLGLIPSCVHPVMNELGLIGLRIQRMPSEPGLEFGIPSHYDYMTVCAPSCHDCSTLRAWWEEDEERRCQFFKTMIGSDKLPPSHCAPEIVKFVLRQHVEAPSMWAIFPLQDLLALKHEYTSRPAVEETINDPTNPRHYWRFRVHVTLESLLKDKELTKEIKDLVRGSGRSYPSEEGEPQVPRQKVGLVLEQPPVATGQDKLPQINKLNGSPKSMNIPVV